MRTPNPRRVNSGVPGNFSVLGNSTSVAGSSATHEIWHNENDSRLLTDVGFRIGSDTLIH